MAKYLIGYANSDESVEFAVYVRQGLEKAVANHPEFDLIWRDNAASNERAIANVQEFVERQVDVAIIYHLDEKIGIKLISPLKVKLIPVISVEHAIPMTTFLGLDDVALGRVAAEEVGRWVQHHWDGQLDRVIVLVDPRRFAGHLKRFASAINTLKQYANFSDNQILYLDGSTEPVMAGERIAAVLETSRDYHRIAILTVSDVMAIAALESARALNREQDIAVLSGNGLQEAIDEFRKPFSRLIVSPAVYPEQYGEHLVNLASRLLAGEKVPQTNWIEPVLLSRAQISAFDGVRTEQTHKVLAGHVS